MREVAGLFEQPLRPLLLHNDMLESNTSHIEIQDSAPFCGLCCAHPTGRDNFVEALRTSDLWNSMESAHASGRKGASSTQGTKTDPTHMPVLGGMACTNIRFGMMWLSRPINSLRYCFLLLWSAATLRLSVAWPCRLLAGYFLLDEDILGFMMTSMW